MPELKKIPFDSLCLSAVVAELQMLSGGKLQRIVQPTSDTLVLGIYAGGKEHQLCLSAHPIFGRVHLVSHRQKQPEDIPHLCRAMRSKMEGARIASIVQVGFDRILRIEFETQVGQWTLVAEIMGKHSNLLLVDHENKIISAAKWLNQSQSSRPISPGRPYTPPPTGQMEPLWEAKDTSDLKGREGVSPFLAKWLQSDIKTISELHHCVQTGQFDPCLAPGFGAYPFDVRPLGYETKAFQSFCHALEVHFEDAVPAYEADQRKRSLTQQLERVLMAREVALQSMQEVMDTSRRASELQRKGELILAYGPSLAVGASVLEAYDYDGNPVTLPLNPDLNFKQNAERFFQKAKRAKSSATEVAEQMARLETDRSAIQETLLQLEAAHDPEEVQRIHDAAKGRRWLFDQTPVAKKAEDRPFEGKKIKELMGPGGEKVFYGENSEANDYLTLRVAKPNDLWLHVRGAQSAHVVIQTHNQPDKVSREALMFAAQVAVRNSIAKHSGYVEVDYTLKKYVRKPKGSPTGFAVYTHEKTLRVEKA